jgi:hypothetical protein
LGLPVPAASEGQVRSEWFALDARARAQMRAANLEQLRRGPARGVSEALDDPAALMARAAELGGQRLRWRSWFWLGAAALGCWLALAAVRRQVEGAASWRRFATTLSFCASWASTARAR